MRKKLIEVALPLEEINKAAAREGYIYKGNPSSIHKWWAQRPLAACRAVLFAQLVDDPSSDPDKFPTEKAQEQERKRLFGIIENLVKWENSNNESVLAAARAEILKSCNDDPPAVLDPFCGGGSIPLEAQRLGLKAYASDLNPVAVLITKALIEIPPKFANQLPINPVARKKMIAGSYLGAQGLADDVRYYGKWMRDEAQKRIGHLYPKVKITAEMAKDRDDLKGMVGKELTVIAWLWARTVNCPNPACGATMPLARTFGLSTKKGKEAWSKPVIDQAAKTLHFEVETGRGKPSQGTVNRKGARCVICNGAAPFDHIRTEAKRGGMSARLMAIVAAGNGTRVYLSPTHEQESVAWKAQPKDVPNTALPDRALGFRVQAYGMTNHRDLFTARQLVALTTLSDLIGEAHESLLEDARAARMSDDSKGIDAGGLGAIAYADAVATYLAFAIDKTEEYSCTIVPWYSKEDRPKGLFARQAIPMVWDFAEVNPLSSIGGTFDASVVIVADALESCPAQHFGGIAVQADSVAYLPHPDSPIVSTDPPYYDNIGYADLSDFFYVWLRRSVGKIYPQLFSTLLVPKAQELIATPHRFDGDKEKAQRFFEEGLGNTFARMREAHNPAYPLTVFYAFKQAEDEASDDEVDASSTVLVSTGWETMLEGLIRAGFQITGTWPMRTERGGRSISLGTNALASSVVLSCRPRSNDAPLATRREFVEVLRSGLRESDGRIAQDGLPAALRKLQHGSIAPVDLAQAAIGPGMAVFSRYSKVLETDGSAMRVRTALGLINQTLDEILAEQEGEYDAESRWTLAWFEQYGTEEGKFGDAETLSRAKDTAINALEEAGIIKAKAGKVQLVPRESLNADWDPASTKRLTIWELTQHLIRALETGGEAAAARIIRRVGSLAETAKDLAYRLYVICDRKGWSQEALAYNMLVKSWPELQKLAAGTSGQTLELSTQ